MTIEPDIKVQHNKTGSKETEHKNPDPSTRNKWKEFYDKGIRFIGRRMAKRDVISVSAKLIDKIKKGELAEEPNLEKETWEEIQEMTQNGSYAGQLSALLNEKYEKHTMSIKDWLPLHDRMIASHRHLRKLNENTKEIGYTKSWPKRY